jgi:hypothetical protein
MSDLTAEKIMSTEFPRFKEIEARGNYEDRHPKDYVTDPSHGGKVTCHTCNRFIIEGEGFGFLDHQHRDEFPKAWFHNKCFNQYEHYYDSQELRIALLIRALEKYGN